MNTQNLPEGILRTEYTLDGQRLRLEYSKARGYEITAGLSWLARRIECLDKALVMIDAASMADWADVQEMLMAARAEWRRLGRTSGWDTPARKHNAMVAGAIARLEGRRPQVTSRGRLVEWVTR